MTTEPQFELSKYSKRHSGKWHHITLCHKGTFNDRDEAIAAAERETALLYPDGLPQFYQDMDQMIWPHEVGDSDHPFSE